MFGMVGFMDCTSSRRWHDFDNVIFANLANAIGGALSNQKKKIELIKAKDEAEKANDSKSEFLSRMSHELRTPMNSILGFAQLLELGNLDIRQKKSVNHILKSGKHLLELINEVLDITRIEAGRLSISLEPVLVSDSIKETIDVVKPLAQENNISIRFIQNINDSLYVIADKQRLKQVLINLINNAIKYNMPNGEVIVKTDLINGNENTDSMIRISVTDTGIGIKPEDITKLFVPFARIHTEKTLIEGTGLGLSVVKKLVEVMNGNVGVESKPGEGSVFWVDFHADTSLIASMEELIISDNHCKETNMSGTILYIEDNDSNIDLVELILLTQRSSVRLVTNKYGSQAVRLAKENSPDVILLDLNLPDMYGEDVLKALKSDEETKGIPVTIVSADVMSYHLKKLLGAGADRYLIKPLDVNEFLNVIDDYIG